jgi:hypothetical protein
MVIDMINSEIRISRVGESGETSLRFLVPQVHEQFERDCSEVLQIMSAVRGTCLL